MCWSSFTFNCYRCEPSFLPLTGMERLSPNEGGKQLQIPEIRINLTIHTETTTGG